MINKSFLRILACNALAYSQDNTYATIAENRVYDTELDDVDARTESNDTDTSDNKNELAPRILVYTDGSDVAFNRQSLNSFASYANVKLKIELVIFGSYEGFGQYNNSNRFLAIISDTFEQQVFDALFKAQNEHAQKFRDFVASASNLQSNNVMDSDSDKKILVKSLEFDVQLHEQYNNSVYAQDRQNILDSYPDYVNLIPTGMRTELEKILVTNDAVKLEVIETEMPILTIQNEYNDD